MSLPRLIWALDPIQNRLERHHLPYIPNPHPSPNSNPDPDPDPNEKGKKRKKGNESRKTKKKGTGNEKKKGNRETLLIALTLTLTKTSDVFDPLFDTLAQSVYRLTHPAFRIYDRCTAISQQNRRPDAHGIGLRKNVWLLGPLFGRRYRHPQPELHNTKYSSKHVEKSIRCGSIFLSYLDKTTHRRSWVPSRPCVGLKISPKGSTFSSISESRRLQHVIVHP